MVLPDQDPRLKRPDTRLSFAQLESIFEKVMQKTPGSCETFDRLYVDTRFISQTPGATTEGVLSLQQNLWRIHLPHCQQVREKHPEFTNQSKKEGQT